MSPKKRSRHKSKKRRSGQKGSRRIRSPRELDKMSEVLLDFIAPYRPFAETDEAMERLIVVGIAAWNTSMLAEDERDAAIEELAMGTLGGQSRIRWMISKMSMGLWGPSRDVEDFRQIVYELIERKLQHYAANRRFIVHYELSQTEDDIHLSVASTLTPV